MLTEQKVWNNWSLRQQNYLNYPTFTEYFVITWLRTYVYCLYAISNYIWHVAMLQKFAGPLVGPLFCGARVRPNMLTCLNPPLGGPSLFVYSLCTAAWISSLKDPVRALPKRGRSNVGVHNTTNIYTGKRQKITEKSCEQ